MRIVTGLVLAAALAAAGCQSAPKKDYLEFSAAGDPTDVASALAKQVGACWFGNAAGQPGRFDGLVYAPELNAYAGRPRILLVPESDPGGLPQLVIEASEAKGATSVKLFGPLLATAGGPGIRADVGRWMGAAEDSGC